MKNIYNNLSLFNKLMLIFSINFLLFLAFIYFFLLPQYENVMLIEKKQGLKYNVEMIFSTLEDYKSRVESGEFTLEQAQQKAIDRIKATRYQEGKNYFWINDLQPVMIMHPTNAKLNGTDISNYKDPNGFHLFSEMVKVCKKDGEGFVPYQWAKVNETNPTDKISYVRLFKDWNWIIGTGIWIDQHDVELQKEIDSIYNYTLMFLTIIIVLVLFVAIKFSKSISRQINYVTNLAREISNGEINIKK